MTLKKFINRPNWFLESEHVEVFQVQNQKNNQNGKGRKTRRKRKGNQWNGDCRTVKTCSFDAGLHCSNGSEISA